MPNRAAQIDTVRRLSKNAKFDLSVITKCQLSSLCHGSK